MELLFENGGLTVVPQQQVMGGEDIAEIVRSNSNSELINNLSDSEIREILDITSMMLGDNMMKLVKGAKGGYMFKSFAEGGLQDEGGQKDPVSGNDVPIGSTKKEVRDDIPAQLSEGEFVFPADVVRYLGLDFLMKLRQKAKAGLQRMDDMGQMGNSEEATLPDDMPFTLDDLDVEEDNRVKFAEGGTPNEEAGVFGKPKDTENNEDSDEASFDDLIGGGSFGKYDELRKFVGPNGEIRYIPFKDGEPLPPYKDILEGLTEKGYTYTPPGEEEEKLPEEQLVGTTQPVETEDKERDRQIAEEDKETRERTLDTAVQQAIEAGMKSEKEIIDWIKGGNVKAGKFKIPGFVYNNVPLPGQDFGPITNAINRNPNVQQGFKVDVELPKSKPTKEQTDAMLSPEGTRKLDKQAETRKIIQDTKKQKVIDDQIANYEKEAGIANEQIDEFQEELQKARNELDQKETEIANKNAQIAEKDAQINKSEQQIQEQNNRISQLSSKTGSAAPNVIKDDRGTTFKGGKLTTDNEGKIVKVNDRPVVVQDNRNDEKDKNRGGGGGGSSFSQPEPKVSSSVRDEVEKSGGYSGGGRYGGFNTGGLASKKTKKNKKVMKRGGLASKK